MLPPPQSSESGSESSGPLSTQTISTSSSERASRAQRDQDRRQHAIGLNDQAGASRPSWRARATAWVRLWASSLA